MKVMENILNNSKFQTSPLFEKIYFMLSNSSKLEKIYIFVPYIKTKVLEKLLKEISNEIIIITTWKINDFISGSSELELYQFCKENNITLYINNKIHLKVYSINLESAIVASGNISQNGLMEGGNYEAGVMVDKLETSDRIYLEKIKTESIFVDDRVYQIYVETYEKCKKQAPEQKHFEDPKITPQKNYFLKSALPMTKNFDDLIQGYININSNLEPSNNSETTACIYHDLANYSIETGLSKDEFIKILKIKFFDHPFIVKIDEFINPEAYFGRIKEWIHDNCTDVPLPRRWELTENVQTLYDWFEKLGDGKYVVDIPGAHSQRITKIKL